MLMRADYPADKNKAVLQVPRLGAARRRRPMREKLDYVPMPDDCGEADRGVLEPDPPREPVRRSNKYGSMAGEGDLAGHFRVGGDNLRS